MTIAIETTISTLSKMGFFDNQGYNNMFYWARVSPWTLTGQWGGFKFVHDIVVPEKLCYLLLRTLRFLTFFLSLFFIVLIYFLRFYACMYI